MFDMRAEYDQTVGRQARPLWHVIRQEDTRTALCGRLLAQDTQSKPPSRDDDTATEQYCSPCMSALGEAFGPSVSDPSAQPDGGLRP